MSPGFWRPDEAAPRLARDPARFATNVAAMNASTAPWKLVQTFNEWGEGTSVEPASEWGTTYLDILAGGTPQPTPTPTPDPSPTQPPPTGDPILMAAGDISCDPASGVSSGSCRDEQTAALLGPATAVQTLGDNQYEAGSLALFNSGYDPTWGVHKAKTHPAIGNHEGTSATSGMGYCSYFGAAANCNASGNQGGAAFYSYNLGAWHIIVLNSNCSAAGGCGVGSPQHNWLLNDLAANTASCTMAVWHHARFSSGASHGSSTATAAFWTALYNANADVILSGHDHDYERFAPQNPSGVADTARGIRQFVVGTGGKNLYQFGTPIANSEVRNNTTFGVLRLDLHANSYDWRFLPEAGKTFTDLGTGTCH